MISNPHFPIEDIWKIMNEVPDPEVPVLSIMDLGIVRGVNWKEDVLEITITPTYTGCPAMNAIEINLKSILQSYGIKNVSIVVVNSPAWTTDWISEEAREKLRKYGIAPPVGMSTDKNQLTGQFKMVKCPFCNSEHTEMISQFGSTACKSLYKCLDCKEPFDYFKCH